MEEGVLRELAKKACDETLPRGEVLTFRRIIEIAERESQRQGSVGYSDFEPELLTEVLNGTWPVSQIGWRLQTIRLVLKQEGWESQGRPVRFYRPQAR
jgi:hypothetical protein